MSTQEETKEPLASQNKDRVIKLVRPRKLAQYDGVPDLVDLTDLLPSHQPFKPISSNKFISLASLDEEISTLPEFTDWCDHIVLPKPLLLDGEVVKGFGRGSKQLGVPTANVKMTEINIEKTAALIPGVYAAIATLTLPPAGDGGTANNVKKHLCAMSIGWNPVYDNAEKTIEAFLIHDFGGEEFYGAHLALEVVSFVRAEALFSDFDSLILAI